MAQTSETTALSAGDREDVTGNNRKLGGLNERRFGGQRKAATEHTHTRIKSGSYKG